VIATFVYNYYLDELQANDRVPTISSSLFRLKQEVILLYLCTLLIFINTIPSLVRNVMFYISEQ
jgi:hypothetical protein